MDQPATHKRQLSTIACVFGLSLACGANPEPSGPNESSDASAANDGDDAGTEQDDDGGPSGNCGEIACSPGKQDCPEGQKCSPYRCRGENCCTDSTHCVPIIGMKEAGDACERDGIEGNDDCRPGLFCKPDGKASGESGTGVCGVLCIPDSEGGDDHCSRLGFEGMHCFNFNGGSYPVCRNTCDPLKQDCPNEKESCYIAVDHFYCSQHAQPDPEIDGKPGDPCVTEQACIPGSGCADKSLVEDCENENCSSSAVCGCCAKFCDLGKENADCEANQECIQVFDNGHPGTEHVGICVNSLGLRP